MAIPGQSSHIPSSTRALIILLDVALSQKKSSYVRNHSKQSRVIATRVSLCHLYLKLPILQHCITPYLTPVNSRCSRSFKRRRMSARESPAAMHSEDPWCSAVDTVLSQSAPLKHRQCAVLHAVNSLSTITEATSPNSSAIRLWRYPSQTYTDAGGSSKEGITRSSYELIQRPLNGFR